MPTTYRKRPTEAGPKELQSLMLKYDRRPKEEHEKLGHDLPKSPIPPIQIPRVKDPSDPELETRDNRAERKEIEEQMREKIEYFETLAYHRGAGMTRPNMKLDEYDFGTILNIRRKTKVEKLAEKLVKPVRFVPPMHLPEWADFSLDSKIPLLDTGAPMTYSRGFLGETLYKKFSKRAFTLEDPRHQRSVPQYSSLHDPHARSYFLKPHVAKLIREQGLVDEEGQVYCSVAELNRYRLYLRHNYYNAVHNQLNHMDNREINIRKENYALASYKAECTKAVRKQTQWEKDQEEKAKGVQDEVPRGTMKKPKSEMTKKEKALQKKIEKEFWADWAKKKHRENRQHYIKNIQRLNVERTKEYREEYKKLLQVKYEIRHEAAERRLEERRQLAKEAARQYELERLDAKYEYQLAYMKQAHGIGQALRDDLKEKARLYLQDVEIRRAAMVDQIAQARAKKARVDKLERKYFFLWLKIVRERKANHPNAAHQSLWDVHAVTHDCVEFLHHSFGHAVRLDEVLEGVLKQNEARLKLLKKASKGQKKSKKSNSFSDTHFKEIDGTDEGDADDEGEGKQEKIDKSGTSI